jgi:glutamate/tyrosine decarboxylase-like PLP-dependent enzyme
MSELESALRRAMDEVLDYRARVGDPEHPVAGDVDVEAFRSAFGVALPEEGTEASRVTDELIAMAEPGLMASAGPRYFGFVIGGATDAATAADLLTTGWDQTAFNAATSPAGALIEEVVGSWLKQALGLPSSASFGITTGAQGANTVGLAAGRHRVLERAGWDVERDGLIGAPPVRVLVGEERHATIDRALRLLGLGVSVIEPVVAGTQGAMDLDALGVALDQGGGGPTIVCAQAGNVNTGAVDDLGRACDLAHRRGAWVHVDGAFGLWAAASPALAHLVDGHAAADSWAVDGHKWLNVPYDAGFVFTADPEAHAASMFYTADYLVGQGEGSVRAPSDFVPESSRRARGFVTWAALRGLGRRGLSELIERCCALARRFGERLGELDGVTIANEIVLNQVLVDFGSDELTDRVIEGIQRDGTCWMGGTRWHGRRLMRIAVSNWRTTEDDVDRSVDAIRRILDRERRVSSPS